MNKILFSLPVFAILLMLNAPSASATEIALEQTKIPEGNFSILLYKPARSELPLKNESAGYITTTYSYQSYFPAFDVSYSAGFTDWTPLKESERNRIGFVLSDTPTDLEISIQGLKYVTEKRLNVDLALKEKTEINYQNYLGLGAKYEFEYSGLKYMISFRTYMIGYKEYWQHVVYPQQYERYAQPQKFLDSFRIDLAKSAEEERTNNNLWDDEGFAWLGKIVNELTILIKTASLKEFAENKLRQIPNSKPYIKNGQYQGQSVFVDNKEFMFIFFDYNRDHVVVANIGIAPVRKEGTKRIYDLLQGSLSKLFVETKKDAFDVGNGYYAFIDYHPFIDQDKTSYAIQILKAKEGAVK